MLYIFVYLFFLRFFSHIGRYRILNRVPCACYTVGPYLEKAMAPHSSTLAWKIPWMEEPGRLQSMGSLRVGHDWATSLSLFTVMHQRKKMATHSSVLAWRIPETAEPGGLPSMGLHRVGHDWSDLATAAAILIYWVCSNLVGCSEASLNLNY